jgi:hypothetical protein
MCVCPEVTTLKPGGLRGWGGGLFFLRTRGRGGGGGIRPRGGGWFPFQEPIHQAAREAHQIMERFLTKDLSYIEP